jgi:hypothetical protein
MTSNTSAAAAAEAAGATPRKATLTAPARTPRHLPSQQTSTAELLPAPARCSARSFCDTFTLNSVDEARVSSRSPWLRLL